MTPRFANIDSELHIAPTRHAIRSTDQRSVLRVTDPLSDGRIGLRIDNTDSTSVIALTPAQCTFLSEMLLQQAASARGEGPAGPPPVPVFSAPALPVESEWDAVRAQVLGGRRGELNRPGDGAA